MVRADGGTVARDTVPEEVIRRIGLERSPTRAEQLPEQRFVGNSGVTAVLVSLEANARLRQELLIDSDQDGLVFSEGAVKSRIMARVTSILQLGNIVGRRRAPGCTASASPIADCGRDQPHPSADAGLTACPGWGVSVSAASIVVAFSGAVRLGGLRSRACRCSRGHRPNGCDTEARDRRATLPQRHRRGVGGSLTRTPLRRAYRLERPCSLPIVRAYFGSV
jgi:hypothetical protein